MDSNDTTSDISLQILLLLDDIIFDGAYLGRVLVGRSLQMSLHYKIKGEQPYDSFISYALCTHKMQSLYIEVTICDPNLGSKPQKIPWGISRQQWVNYVGEGQLLQFRFK